MGLAPPSATHEGDHIDVDSLNNTRANLRWSTKAEQNANQKPRITKAQKVAYAVAEATGDSKKKTSDCKKKSGKKTRIKFNPSLADLGSGC